MRIAIFTLRFVPMLVLGCLSSCRGSEKSRENLPVASMALRSEYDELSERARRFNSDPAHMNHWCLNVEHCFESDLGKAHAMAPDGFLDFPDALRTRVMDFVLKPGAVDFLFDHLAQNEENESAVLVDAEMLQFFSEMGPASNGPSFAEPSRNVAEIEKMIKSGAFAKADSKYPAAHILEIIEVSTERCKAVSN